MPRPIPCIRLEFILAEQCNLCYIYMLHALSIITLILITSSSVLQLAEDQAQMGRKNYHGLPEEAQVYFEKCFELTAMVRYSFALYM